MLQKIKLLNLRLFDAGAAPAGAAPAQAPGTAAGETAQALPSAAGKAKRANPFANVKFGIQESGQGTEPAEADGQQQAQKEPPAAAEEKGTATDPEARNSEFEKLIKGDFKDLFDARVQGIINQRFAETKTLQSQLDKVNPVLQMLAGKYGVDAGDAEKLAKAIEADDSFYEAEAASRGLTVDQLKDFKRMERENARFREAQADIERRQNAEKTYSEWMQQAGELKKIYPAFDLQAEIKNESFLKMITNGVGLQAAYQSVHMDEIMSGAMQHTAQVVREKTVANIASRASRPTENGVASGAGVVVKSDVSKLTAAERAEIARRAAAGEKIRF